jgi:hypothetical protein
MPKVNNTLTLSWIKDIPEMTLVNEKVFCKACGKTVSSIFPLLRSNCKFKKKIFACVFFKDLFKASMNLHFRYHVTVNFK